MMRTLTDDDEALLDALDSIGKEQRIIAIHNVCEEDLRTHAKLEHFSETILNCPMGHKAFRCFARKILNDRVCMMALLCRDEIIHYRQLPKDRLMRMRASRSIVKKFLLKDENNILALPAMLREALVNWFRIHICPHEDLLIITSPASTSGSRRRHASFSFSFSLTSSTASTANNSPMNTQITTTRTTPTHTKSNSTSSIINLDQDEYMPPSTLFNSFLEHLEMMLAVRYFPTFVASSYYHRLLSVRLAADRIHSIDDFELLRCLGVGGFGRVFAAKHKESKMVYAVKMMRKKQIFQRKREQFVLNEVDIMRKIHHPFIIELHYAFHDDYYLYLCMEYARGGDLRMQLEEQGGKFTEDASKFYIASVILALETLHNNGIVYRDLKPENIIMDALGYIQLGDLGLCEYLPATEPKRVYKNCGTRGFMSPQQHSGIDGYGCETDWWSLGVLLIIFLTGVNPFSSFFKKKEKEDKIKKENKQNKNDNNNDDDIDKVKKEYDAITKRIDYILRRELMGGFVGEHKHFVTNKCSIEKPVKYDNDNNDNDDNDNNDNNDIDNNDNNNNNNNNDNNNNNNNNDNNNNNHHHHHHHHHHHSDSNQTVLSSNVVVAASHVHSIQPELLMTRRASASSKRKIDTTALRNRELEFIKIFETAIEKIKIEYKTRMSSSAHDFVVALLTIDPNERLGSLNGAKDLKDHHYFADFDWKRLEKKHMLPPVVPEHNFVHTNSCFTVHEHNEKHDMIVQKAYFEQQTNRKNHQFTKFEYSNRRHFEESLCLSPHL